MPIKLELSSQTLAEFTAELEALIAVIRPLVQATAASVTVEVPATAPDEAHTIVDEQFEAEGYEATITPSEPKPAEPAKLAGKRGRKPLAAVDEALKSLKTNGGEPPQPTAESEPEPAPEPREDPESDRKFVIEKLGALVKNPDHRPKVFDFASRMARTHGATKIHELPAPPFPTIRRAFEKEFPDA